MNKATVVALCSLVLGACFEEPEETDDAAFRAFDPSQGVLTVGTNASKPFEVGERTTRSQHGVRIYCPVSHFSYDDPIIFPGQPDRAHLHMFAGNTSVDAFTVGTELVNEGASSCDGGTLYRSSTWMPALLRAGQAVVPQATFLYYKSFASDDVLSRAHPIPNGLEMLASKETMNHSSQVSYGEATHAGVPSLRFSLVFPECVATDASGEPVLRYQDMPGELASVPNSHVAYPGGPNKNAAGCPSSHPHRFIGPQFIVFYNKAEVGNDWVLSSDLQMGKPQGGSLHADYIAAIDAEVNEEILRCVQEARNCEFPQRGHLPERFYAPDGTRVYAHSAGRAASFDPTPFGTSFGPVAPGAEHDHGGGDHGAHEPVPMPEPTPTPQPQTFPVEGQWYTLENVQRGRFLDTDGSGGVDLAAGGGSAEQHFTFLPAGDGSFWIVNRAAGRGALDTEQYARVVWNGADTPSGADKLWRIEAAGDGSYRIFNQWSGRGPLAANAESGVAWISQSWGTDGERWIPVAVQ